MGIYIKSMKMPKSCDECRIMVFEDTNCVPELFCGCPIVFKAHPQGVGHRPDYCPLVEVHPHGRLIDADALMQEFYKAQKSYDAHGRPFSDAFMSGNEICTEWWAVERKVEDAPTIIPADKDGEV